jgi:hypothetical protein
VAEHFFATFTAIVEGKDGEGDGGGYGPAFSEDPSHKEFSPCPGRIYSEINLYSEEIIRKF